MMKSIDQFDTEWADLSNFSTSPLVWEGMSFPTAEHAFQAAKVLGDDRELVRTARTPGEAKLLGTALKNRPDWSAAKVAVMREILRAKFSQNLFLADLLLSTGDRHLAEGNTWDDRFWGVVNGNGENWLGRLLMEVREDLRSGRLVVCDASPIVTLIVARGKASEASEAKLNHPYADGTGATMKEAASGIALRELAAESQALGLYRKDGG